MNLKLALILSISLVVLNIILCHFYCFSGMAATPGVALIVSAIIALLVSGIRLYQRIIIVAGLLILNDVGLKLYASGSHDQVGQSWQTLFTIAGILVALCILIVAAVKEKRETRLHKISVLLAFPILLMIHLYLTMDLGLGRYYLCN